MKREMTSNLDIIPDSEARLPHCRQVLNNVIKWTTTQQVRHSLTTCSKTHNHRTVTVTTNNSDLWCAAYN